MEVLGSPITIRQLKTIAKDLYGDMVKAVVDISVEILAIDRCR